jgi:hypothetical protein
MKTRNSLLLLSTASLFACSTLVGADFDDRNVGSETTGGSLATSGGTTTQGGQTTSGSTPGKGGATQTSGGSSNSGGSTVSSGGATGNAGQTTTGGSSPSGGTPATGGSSVGPGGVGPGGSSGQGGEGGFGGVGGEAQGGTSGAGGEPNLTAGAGGEAGGGAPPGNPVVVLNEVKGQGPGNDFVELYNLGPGALALEGYGLSDQNNTFVFPSGATIVEGGYVLLLLGQMAPVNGNYTCFTPNPCYHATWGISQNGETVYFRGRQNQVLDQTAYPSQTGAGSITNDQTWGRLPDGTGAFRATRPTPEKVNQGP